MELSACYALILIVIWTPRPLQRLLYCVTAVFLIAILVMTFESWDSMGLRIRNLRQSLWIAGAALLVAACAMAIAARMHTLNVPDGALAFLHRYLGYAVWAVFQQILLQTLFLRRLLRITNKPGFAALSAALLFSLAHLPNPILTPITFVWGLAACVLFLRYRNLYPLAFSHAVFGIVLAMTVPGSLTHNMRVGWGYVTYSHHPGYHRSHIDQIVSTQACVIADAPTRRSRRHALP